MSLSPGHKLAHYEIVEPIGKGGMGEVYRAKDGKLGRDVAIKVLPDEFAQDEERLRRFQREAKVLASLNHSNIASIYGLEQSGKTHYLVLELVPGETLADRISRGPIPVDEALEIANKIAEALEEAHERGIVHRDLKPANIKLTPDDKVKAADFVSAWSRDGSEIVMYSLRGGNRDVYTMSSDGGSVRQLTDHPAEERSGNCSADGNLIAFTSPQRGGVFIVSSAGETPPRLLDSGGPYFSPDGRWRTGLESGSGESAVLIVSSDETEVRTLVESIDDVLMPKFSKDSQSVFYKRGTLPGQSGIWSVSIDGGEPRLMVDFDDPDRPAIRREFDVSADRIYFTLSEHESDVWLLELEDGT